MGRASRSWHPDQPYFLPQSPSAWLREEDLANVVLDTTVRTRPGPSVSPSHRLALANALWRTNGVRRSMLASEERVENRDHEQGQ